MMTPKGWMKVPLASLATVQTGIAKGKLAISSPISLPYLRVANVQDGRVDLTVIKKMTVSRTDVARYSLRSGDVLFTEGGDFDKLGRGTVWRGQIEPCLHQNHVFAVRPDPALLLPGFLAYQAASDYGRRYFQLSAKQSTNLASINSTQLKDFPILLPPLTEQHKIVEILRTWDEAIEGVANLIKLLRSRRETISYVLFSERQHAVKTAFFGEFLKESRLPGSEGVVGRKITVKLYGKGAVPKVETRPGSTRTRYYRRTAGQLIYSKLDFLNGAFAIVPESLNEYQSSLDLPAFDISEHVNSKWLLEYLIRPSYYSRQLHLARGQRKARRIAPTDFLTSPIKLPDRNVQDHIASTLASADDEIASQCSLLEMYNRQKKGLMQKFLTGIWRVDTTGPRLTRSKD